jgi:uncharacterized protein (DUF2147 family)
MRHSGAGNWEDGKIYNPDDGKEYKAVMSMQQDGSLRVRAYVFLPLLGSTQVWTRVS